MSIPRLLLAPTHRTGLANALAAAAAEILTAQGRRVRYHHAGPLGPVAAWDRWEGAVFLDPALYSEQILLALYEAATRGADVSLLSSSVGLLDRQEGAWWVPADLARLLDCPVVAVLDCRDWGTGVRILAGGLKAHMSGLDLAGVVLAGVADRDHFIVLRRTLSEEGLKVVGCLFEGDGPGWKDAAPGAWGLPLEPALLEAVSRQVNIEGLLALAGRRGFLPAQRRLNDRSAGGPLVAVAAGKGFTPWSRDSIEVLRAAGAQVERLDLVEDEALPVGVAGLILAGTLWPGAVSDVALNLPLLESIRGAVQAGLPTLALGGGMLLLLDRVRDTLGRTSETAGVVSAEAEIVCDLEDATYVELVSKRDNLLLAQNEEATGWLLSEVELSGPGAQWEPLFTARAAGAAQGHPEGMGGDTLVCSQVLIHLASTPGMAEGFVERCAAYASRRAQTQPAQGPGPTRATTLSSATSPAGPAGSDVGNSA